MLKLGASTFKLGASTLNVCAIIFLACATGHQPVIKILNCDRRELDADEVPAKAWLEETVKNKKRSINKELVPYVGSLSLTIRAQISNWFDVKIGQDKKKQRQWLGRLPIAHAYTIYIAMNLKAN